MTDDLYYVRNKDARFLGNAPVWWCKNGQGYSAYLEKAEKFTKDRAEKLVNEDSDKWEMWPCWAIDSETHTVFDWQAIKRIEQEIEKRGATK